MRKLRRVRATECRDSPGWINNEVMSCRFQDVRHGKRMRQLLEQLAGKVGATTPWACQDWANTKAAYRFFSNERVAEANILAGHFASTRERFSATSVFPILVLHDTTEISFTREHVAAIGMLKKLTVGYTGKYHTTCGILMHSSLGRLGLLNGDTGAILIDEEIHHTAADEVRYDAQFRCLDQLRSAQLYRGNLFSVDRITPAPDSSVTLPRM